MRKSWDVAAEVYQGFEVGFGNGRHGIAHHGGVEKELEEVAAPG